MEFPYESYEWSHVDGTQRPQIHDSLIYQFRQATLRVMRLRFGVRQVVIWQRNNHWCIEYLVPDVHVNTYCAWLRDRYDRICNDGVVERICNARRRAEGENRVTKVAFWLFYHESPRGSGASVSSEDS